MSAPFKIQNGGFPLPTFLLVHVKPNADEMQISHIELWVEQCADKAPHMVYDDLQVSDLSAEVQADLFLELRAAEISREEKARQLRRFDAAIQSLGLAPESGPSTGSYLQRVYA